jgi:hypothetical protein
MALIKYTRIYIPQHLGPYILWSSRICRDLHFSILKYRACTRIWLIEQRYQCLSVFSVNNEKSMAQKGIVSYSCIYDS